eukprot:13343888-Alexandrium_andersonii.AAC.1
MEANPKVAGSPIGRTKRKAVVLKAAQKAAPSPTAKRMPKAHRAAQQGPPKSAHAVLPPWRMPAVRPRMVGRPGHEVPPPPRA